MLDAKYDAVATRSEGVDTALIGWSNDPTLTIVCEYRKNSSLENVEFKLDWNLTSFPDSIGFPKGGPG